MKQTKAILIALFLGLAVGLTLNLAAPSIFDPLNQYVFNPLGQLFIRLIKMLVVPVVFISIVLGVAGLGDPKQLGRIGLKSISFFLVTTAVAISIAVTFALIIKPGAGGNFNTEGLKYEGAKRKHLSSTHCSISYQITQQKRWQMETCYKSLPLPH